ncbi:MAG: hypothetical protein M3O70_24980 [Actinomycetota bacterium]|nr:hypothetical protein [Actinomycetota bacterium]
MDTREARKILLEVISDLRKLSYEELSRFMDEPGLLEITGDSGTWYQLEIIVFIDDPKVQTLRVSVGIDDGGWRAFCPVTDDFIIAPDGSFVGE